MANLTDLAKRMNRLAAKIPLELSRCAVETALVMERVLVRETPVDTSLHLSNWIASLDDPFDYEIPANVEGSRGSTKIISGNEAMWKAKNEIGYKKPEDVIFLSNNGPVIRGLNDGSISMQPGGFVEKSLIVGIDYIHKFKMNLE